MRRSRVCTRKGKPECVSSGRTQFSANPAFFLFSPSLHFPWPQTLLGGKHKGWGHSNTQFSANGLEGQSIQEEPLAIPACL